MANKIEQIALKEKKKIQAKQDADVIRFSKKIAEEILNNIGQLDRDDKKELQESIVSLSKSVAEAIVSSNTTFDNTLKDNFSKLLVATKNNDNRADQNKIFKQIGTSLSNFEVALSRLELSPQINVTGLTKEELKKEIDKILSKLPDSTKRDITIAYDDVNPTKYLNVRLTDGFNFYKAFAGGGGGGAIVDTSALATSAKQDDIVQAIQGISGTTNKTTRIQTVGTRTYIGNAAIGSAESASVWQIKVLDTPGLTKLWADGNDNFDNVWDDRATVTYL